MTESYNARSAIPVTLRSKAEVTRFSTACTWSRPVTLLGQWAPGAAAPGPAHLPTYTALAVKP